MFPKVNASDGLVFDDFIRMTTGENGTLVDDVGMIANTECFTNVVVGNQYTDASFLSESGRFAGFR